MMNLTRSLSFEINRSCDMGKIHSRCPNMHPDRFRYGKSKIPLSSDAIFEFWKWGTAKHGFRGICNMSWYGEPTLALDQIRSLIARIKSVDPMQPFQIVTNREDGDFEKEFDIVKRSHYRSLTRLCDDGKPDFDNRTLSIQGEGKPYSSQPPFGHCLRGLGWEIGIDYYGSWCLCCADFTNEESVGSIMTDNWDQLYERWKAKASRIRWTNEEEYNALPRLCRSCLDVNPSLHFREDVDLIRRLPRQKEKDFGTEVGGLK